MAKQRQPAHINYFFKGGYVELWATIATAFEKCGETIHKAKRALGDAISDLDQFCYVWGLTLWILTFGNHDDDVDAGGFFGFFWAVIRCFFFLMNLICVAIITTISTALFSVLHTIILVVFFILAYIFFAVVKIADVLYCSLKKISTSCPQCQRRYSLPAYICKCGAEHTKLVPGKYGIFTRRCNCNKRLNTTFINGRHKLPGAWKCPFCKYELGGPLQVDLPIPVVGGPSSGKTCFISMSISKIEEVAPTHKLRFEYKENIQLGDDYKINKATMEKGLLPRKTSELRMRYYQFYLTPRRRRVRNLVSLCDVAGETYDKSDEIGKQIGYKNANVFLLILDPLSLKKFRASLSPQEAARHKGSARSIDEVLDVLVRTLDNLHGSSSKSKLKADVAIVFTKCDVPGVEEKIGDSAVQNYMSGQKKCSVHQARNQVCEDFLMENEEFNFLNLVKHRFTSYQFFTSSALGSVQTSGQRFVSQGVAEPVLWLVDKASTNINLKKLWGKKI